MKKPAISIAAAVILSASSAPFAAAVLATAKPERTPVSNPCTQRTVTLQVTVTRTTTYPEGGGWIFVLERSSTDKGHAYYHRQQNISRPDGTVENHFYSLLSPPNSKGVWTYYNDEVIRPDGASTRTIRRYCDGQPFEERSVK